MGSAFEYIYLGDRHTDPALRGKPCAAVRRADGKCIRGRNGSMLVACAHNVRMVVVGRCLRKINTTLAPSGPAVSGAADC